MLGWEGPDSMSYCSYKGLSVLGRGGEIGRKIEKGERGDRERGWCVFSWSTSSLMLALICLGWKLSTRLEYWWLLLRTPLSPPPLFLPLSHLHPLHLSSLHILCILSAQLISCLLSLSPLFTLLISAFSRCSCTSPTQISLPSLLYFYPSLYLTSLYLSRFSVYHLPATISSSIPPPYCLFRPVFLPILSLISPSASSCILLVFSALAFCFLSFRVGPTVLLVWSASCHLSVSLPSSVSLPGLCELVPGLCGSQGWWDMKS